MSNKRDLFPILLRLLLSAAAIAALPGCSLLGGDGASKVAGSEAASAKPQVVRYDGEPSKELPFVYTGRKELALTFNGLADDKTLRALLDELDKYGIKATFFVPGMRAAEEPDLVKEIVSRGHEIENNTLSRLDMTKLNYEQIYNEIHLDNEIIERETGVRPSYVRTKSGDYNDDVRLVAAQEGMKAVVRSSFFLHNWNGQSEREKLLYIRKHTTRGGILTVDTEELDDVASVIPLFAEAAKEVGYRFVLLDELVRHGSERKPLEQIEGYDAIRMNADYGNAKYDLIYNKPNAGKRIALTFDDWGTDYTITKILDILDKYRVKATFFLRANGVEANPNLARAILDDGDEVANHTYSHPVVTTLSPERLQEDILRAYRVITEAIQERPTMLFRPPTGKIDETTAKVIAAMGYDKIAQYDVDSSDYLRDHTAKQITDDVLSQAHDGSIVLMHMLDDTHTEEALPAVIEGLERKGYKLVTVTELIGEKN